MDDPDPTASPALPSGTSSRAAAPVADSGANPDAPVPFVFGRRIAQGGMGAVLEAQDCRIGRTIAVKVMLSASTMDEERRKRFVNEAAVLGRLEHPNIVPIHDLGRTSDGELYYTMKLVKGRTLQSILNDIRDGVKATLEHYPLNTLLTIFRKVCDAMAFAHSRGIIHRDLKPENIMVGEFGEVLVMDWGLAKILSAREDLVATIIQTGTGGTGAHTPEGGSVSMTLDGSIMGTPRYMSPEQALGDIAGMGPLSDIFSLGGILYAILTLRPPVEGKTLDEVMQRVISGDITPPSAFGAAATGIGTPTAKGEVLEAKKIKPLPHCPGGRVPSALSSVAMKALTVEREKRYQTTAEFSADIEAYQNGFATGAEQASLMKQILLLIQRHKGVFATAFAAWFIITALAVWFVVAIKASERETRRQAEIAIANEQRAVERGEATRRALAKSQIALADAAYGAANGQAMRAALATVPEDLRDPDWSYLMDRSDASIATVRSGVEVTGVAAHPNEPGVFAVGGDDGKIAVLRVRTGETLLEFEPVFSPQNDPENKRYNLAFSPDGEHIAIGHLGKGILIHGARDGKKLAEWDSSRWTSRLQFSPDGRLLLQGTLENNYRGLTLWEVASGRELWSRDPLEKSDSAAFTSDGERIVSLGFVPWILSILNVQDGAVVMDLKTLLPFPVSIAMHPHSNMIIAGGVNGHILGMSLEDKSVLFMSRMQDQEISHLAFTPDGNRFVAVAVLHDGRQSIELRDAKDGKLLKALLGGRGQPHAIALHPVSGEVLLGGKDSRLWNVAKPPEIWATDKPGGAAQFWGSDDILFARNSSGRFVALWDLREGRMIWEPVSKKDHSRVNISADGRYAAIPGDPLIILRWATGGPEVIDAGLSCEFYTMVRLSPDGSMLVIRIGQGDSWGARFEIHESSSGKELCAFRLKAAVRVNDLGWVSDGTRIVGLATMNSKRGDSASEERIITLDAATGEELQSLVHPSAMDVLAVSPDGLSFAEAGADRRVRIRDAATLAVKRQFRVHDQRVTTLAWHPTKPILATGSADFSVKIWNIETGRLLEEFDGLVGTPSAMSFSPGGTRLACSVAGDATHVWEPKSLQ